MAEARSEARYKSEGGEENTERFEKANFIRGRRFHHSSTGDARARYGDDFRH